VTLDDGTTILVSREGAISVEYEQP
jgi:hypothetical protein